MSIHKRNVGFHAPVTLPNDAVEYADGLEAAVKTRNESVKGAEAVVIPGNAAKELARIRDMAQQVRPKVARIIELEAALSAAYAEYDKSAVELWHVFTEARDFARDYAERHDLADIASIANAYLYHVGRACRRTAEPTPQAGDVTGTAV